MKLHILFAVLFVFVATVPLTNSFAESKTESSSNNEEDEKNKLGDLVVSVSPVKNQVDKNQKPKLSGSVTDQNSDAVPSALVKITTSSETIWTSTNKKGSFEYEFSKGMEPGIYAINIMAKKDQYGIGYASTSFSIEGQQNPETHNQENTEKQMKTKTNFAKATGKELENDPVAKKLKEHAEKIQKKVAEQEKKESEIKERKQFINKQRKIALEEMQKDLKQLKLETMANTPRNAFALFVLQLDDAVQDLFWAQFAFTEKLSDRAHQKKLEALEKGISRQEAMKIFNENAASSRKDIIEHNEKLNIDKGFADKRGQSRFNSEGKIPRDDKN